MKCDFLCLHTTSLSSQNLATILCQQTNIKYEYCLIAINELQYTALDNLKSIEEFKETGKSPISSFFETF